MENEKLNEYESLELITKMIERAKRTEIGRLNFVNIGLGDVHSKPDMD